MNKARRERISKLISELEPMVDKLESICSEEEDYFENMPEGLQQSERGQEAEAAISELEEAKSSLDSLINALENAKGA